MTRRTGLMWAVVAATGLVFVADTVVVAVTQGLLSSDALTRHGWPLVNLASFGSAVFGAMIVSREWRNAVGWLLLLVGTTASLSLLVESYSYWAYETGDPHGQPLATAAAHLATITGGVLALTVLTLVFLIVPDGRFQSRRWRAVGVTAVAGYVVFTIGMVSYDPFVAMEGPLEPGEVPALSQTLVNIGFVLVALCVLASVVAMVRRLRASTGETRQQLRWVATGAVAIGLGVLSVVVGQLFSGGEATWYVTIPLFVAYVAFLVTVAVAVLRYRLYDIDLVLSRAVLLSAAVVFVAGCYVVLVLVVGDRLSWAEGFWPTLAATVVVAIAFQPLRFHVVRFANRLAYGERAAPYDALAEFSRRLGQSPDATTLLPTIAAAAGRATLATKAMVRLDGDDGPAGRASWPLPGEAWSAEGATVVQVPIEDADGRLGTICVWPPPGIELRAQDRRLLHDIARQAAVALRNVGLEVELAAHVATLDVQTEQLAASRRRLIEAHDAERRRLEAAIRRDVLPGLEVVRDALADVRAGRRTADRVDVDALIAASNDALEMLRVLTRGVFPTLLARSGLAAALASFGTRAGSDVRVTVGESVAGRRFGERLEMAAYYCCTEAVIGSVGSTSVEVAYADGGLRIDVGFEDPRHLDLDALRDRVEACEGRLAFDAAGDGAAARLRVVLPVPEGQEPVAVVQA